MTGAASATMVFKRRRLSTDRADGLELKLRARAEQMKPTEQLGPNSAPLGLCHACTEAVYAGDSLVVAGVYVFHDRCAPSGR